VQKTVEELGSVDILMNNAGIPSRMSPMEITEDFWDKVMDIDLKGPLFGAQVAGKRMIEQGRGGVIISTSSAWGMKPPYYSGGYASAKGGLILLTKQLAVQLAPHNIRVNAIAPGLVKTGTSRDLWSNPDKLKDFLVSVPAKRPCEPIEIANVALFLASDRASYITGVAIPVDGGMVAYG
jgi:NAD(P)-dependent dehydrogenase (short-subunit alcohol dehydrogenase family)